MQSRELNAISETLKRHSLTAFQRRVLMECARIPKGSTVSYAELARRAGRPNAYRAVGSVMRINPFAPRIPCHRVVKSDGSIGNYSGRGGKKTKLRLLKKEGAPQPSS